MADLHDAGRLLLDGPCDPDAQATVTDYIDYTEYLPADLIRSLTLIRGLDERYIDAAQGVHDLSRTYGQLPSLPADDRPDPRALRKDISAHLDRAINARESAYAEACRLYEVIDRHFNRLDSIKQKLEALPKPASREPTPPPVQPLPASKRARASKKADEAAAPPTTTRITLRLDSHDTTRASAAQKSRTRRSIISAEHLADLHPDSPIASTEHSDVEGDTKMTSSESPAAPSAAPTKKEKARRRSRVSALGPATASGSGPALSTSNALAMLKPPPEDAQPGSPDMPWLRLTEWEMTKLRKKMKKNAVWQPSEVMIHRELALRGRGWEAYRAAKMQADATGAAFIDCDDIMNTYVPGKLMKRSEANGDTEATYETKLSNRGMKLNEAKKLKRENQAREQAAALAAAAAQEQGTGQPVLEAPPVIPQENPAKPSRTGKKRKFEEATPTEVAPVPAPTPVSTAAPFPSPAGVEAVDEAMDEAADEAADEAVEQVAEEVADDEVANEAADEADETMKDDATSESDEAVDKVAGGDADEVEEAAVEATEFDKTSDEAALEASDDVNEFANEGASKAEKETSQAAEAGAEAALTAPTASPEVETRSSLRSAKRRRTSKDSHTPVDPIPEAPTAPAAEAPEKPKPASPTEPKRSQPPTAIKAASPPATRPSSRRSAALSLEPTSNVSAVATSGRDLRRKSATPARRTPVPETARAASASAPPRKRKRPAPGPVSSGQDGGAAVSYGRRKAKPGKKRIATREVGLKDGTLAREDIRIDEDGVLEEIDPNEPRYCMCGDVSFGTMICCENPDCDREWFHLDCIGLSEVPSRTAKWYCPDCRVRFKKGVDGIVKSNPRR
ncbi:hypothetical protein BO70DRAFT_348743 [Aspergillus heteromorphus CBS 117.55]|uniref:Chromatin modification-related protein n=1 Tax=Aspergillus heteromorphus CBS 117.55 TaxID=1448321 RepID=A0A317X2H4_9EURO|nr:uncharacterized protein BO70DRAFT_348743 [Aspergillus heteromorphus CBS 117.55]PWY92351.1 hypothetical protein BO70DRAFT_348743 [Aspergillus heteromorphus CBS 117.55]